MTSTAWTGDDHPAPSARRRHLRLTTDTTPIHLTAAQRAVRALLSALGQDPDSEHLRDTPRLVADSTPNCSPQSRSPSPRSPTTTGYDELVLARDLPFQ